MEEMGQEITQRESRSIIARQREQLKQFEDNIYQMNTREQEQLNHFQNKFSRMKAREEELEATVSRQQNQLDQCQDMFFQMDAKEQELRATVATQQKELEQCYDDLFNIQPATQIPDTQVLAQYEELCQSISSWTDNILSQFEKERDGHSYFEFDCDMSDSAQKLLLSTPEIAEYYVSAMIHQWIQKHILGSDVYAFGISENHILTSFKSLLEEMEVIMSGFAPPRGRYNCQTYNCNY